MKENQLGRSAGCADSTATGKELKAHPLERSPQLLHVADSNWERIESLPSPLAHAEGRAPHSNWERIERHVLRDVEAYNILLLTATGKELKD